MPLLRSLRSGLALLQTWRSSGACTITSGLLQLRAEKPAANRQRPPRSKRLGMKRTLFSLWCIVTALMLGSFGGSLWISEKNTLAVLCFIGMVAFFVTGLLVYTRWEERRAREGKVMTPLEWWIRKVLNA